MRLFQLGAFHGTGYVIRRDHSNETQFFQVSVPEAGHRGVGGQVRLGPYVVGLSVTHVGRRRCRHCRCLLATQEGQREDHKPGCRWG